MHTWFSLGNVRERGDLEYPDVDERLHTVRGNFLSS